MIPIVLQFCLLPYRLIEIFLQAQMIASLIEMIILALFFLSIQSLHEVPRSVWLIQGYLIYNFAVLGQFALFFVVFVVEIRSYFNY